jgi:hypothetical protein
MRICWSGSRELSPSRACATCVVAPERPEWSAEWSDSLGAERSEPNGSPSSVSPNSATNQNEQGEVRGRGRGEGGGGGQ